MTQTLTPKVLILGGGPGGYVAAIRCGQLGLDTVLVEKDRVGGTCLIRGCIPSKALIHAAGTFATVTQATGKGHLGITVSAPPILNFSETIGWKDGVVNQLNGGVAALLKRAGVRTLAGHGRFSDAKTCHVITKDGDITVRAEHVILAAGSVPVELPFLRFGGRVISSTEALSLPEVPKRLVVIGAGYVGLELGIAYRKFGADVTIVEARNHILPVYDEKLSQPVRQWLDHNGVTLHLGAAAVGLDETGTGLSITTSKGDSLVLPADAILVTVGRKPATQGWGLEEMAIGMKDGFIQVDDRCATTTKNVWAIGDLVGEPMLAHKASAQGEVVAEIIAGHRGRFAPVAIPAICFTEPEIISVGRGPEADDGMDCIVAVFPLRASGRALSMDAAHDGGFVRVVVRKGDHRILGIQAVGQHISEMAGEFTTALEMGAVLEDIDGIVHAHPTLGEAFREAALKGLGKAVHI